MPVGVLRAYARFMDGLSLWLCLDNGLGAATSHPCGIPQGRPFHMTLAALLSRPWVPRARRLGAQTKTLADGTR
eukprot:3182220-Lingulodinium_polyedra.AAC.1